MRRMPLPRPGEGRGTVLYHGPGAADLHCCESLRPVRNIAPLNRELFVEISLTACLYVDIVVLFLMTLSAAKRSATHIVLSLSSARKRVVPIQVTRPGIPPAGWPLTGETKHGSPSRLEDALRPGKLTEKQHKGPAAPRRRPH